MTKSRCQIVDQEKVNAAMDYAFTNLALQNSTKSKFSQYNLVSKMTSKPKLINQQNKGTKSAL